MGLCQSSKVIDNYRPISYITISTDNFEQDYVVGELLGEGAYGTVYSAFYRPGSEFRAVKKIKKPSIRQEKYRKNVIKESSILNCLEHSNVIKYIDCLEDAESYYIITEIFISESMLDHILYTALPEPTALSYFKQLLSAVAYTHSKGITHRDIKLENILISGNTVKLIDLGSASSHSVMHRNMGTCLYSAPETFDRHYTNKCDIWSCGVILYVFLSGKMPFGGSGLDEVETSVKCGRVKMEGSTWQGKSDFVKGLIKKMFTINPLRRPSAHRLLKLLD